MAEQQKKRRYSVAVFAILATSAAVFALLWQRGLIWFNMPSYSRYPVRGVDVSHYQGEIDWAVLSAQHVQFAFLKATEGSSSRDEYFAQNWQNARAAGVKTGAYHFFSFDSAASTQADNFCAVVPAEPDALPPVIDLEYYRREGEMPAPAEITASLRVLLERMRSFYGKKPIIYTTKSCWENYLQDTDLDYTLWIRSTLTAPPQEITPEWTFWQYHPRGRLKGYDGEEPCIDLNIFNGTEADFAAYCSQ